MERNAKLIDNKTKLSFEILMPRTGTVSITKT